MLLSSKPLSQIVTTASTKESFSVTGNPEIATTTVISESNSVVVTNSPLGNPAPMVNEASSQIAGTNNPLGNSGISVQISKKVAFVLVSLVYCTRAQ